jgi:hypothetical protein
LVIVKPGAVAREFALALTEYLPDTVFAVNTGEVAKPCALVMAVLPEQANVPLAPVPGALKVTTTPETGLPPESRTVAASGWANGFVTTAVCGVPLVVAMDAGVRGSVTITITGTVIVMVFDGYWDNTTSPV